MAGSTQEFDDSSHLAGGEESSPAGEAGLHPALPDPEAADAPETIEAEVEGPEYGAAVDAIETVGIARSDPPAETQIKQGVILDTVEGEWNSPLEFALLNLFSTEALARSINKARWNLPAAFEVLSEIARNPEIAAKDRVAAVLALESMASRLLTVTGHMQEFKLTHNSGQNSVEMPLRRVLDNPPTPPEVLLEGANRVQKFLKSRPELEADNATGQDFKTETVGGFTRPPNSEARGFDHGATTPFSMGDQDGRFDGDAGVNPAIGPSSQNDE